MASTIQQISDLLRQGRISEANDLALKASEAESSATAAGADVAAAPAAPRTPDAVFSDLLTAIVSHIGNPPLLVQLLDELAALKK